MIALSAAAGFLMWVVWSKSDKNSQLQARVVIILMGFLVLFGGGLDTLQSDFSGNLAYGIGVFEDGVELLVASTVLVASRIFLKEYVINKNR